MATALTPATGHHGFEGPLFNGKLQTGSYFHYLHHRYFTVNYGVESVPLDKWFGSFHDGSPEAHAAMVERRKKSKAVQQDSQALESPA